MTEALNSNVPTIDNLGVGYNGPGNGDESVRSVLKWGGDNTGSGKECVWMSVKDLRAQYYSTLPDETQFMAYATWFASIGTGKCSFELVGYKGGTMSQDGYNFINTGGSVVYQNTYDLFVIPVRVHLRIRHPTRRWLVLPTISSLTRFICPSATL